MWPIIFNSLVVSQSKRKDRQDTKALKSWAMPDFSSAKPRSLSEIRLIYYGCAGFGQIFRSFSLNSPTIRLKRSKHLTQTSTSS